MINPIINKDTDEFIHSFCVLPMDDIANPFHENNKFRNIVLRIWTTIATPPVWNSIDNAYKISFNESNLKSRMSTK